MAWPTANIRINATCRHGPNACAKAEESFPVTAPSPSSLNEWPASRTRRTTRTRTTTRTMKILLLNQAFHPDVVASGQHLTDLALALVQRGHAVTVVTSRRAYDNQTVR